MYTNRALKENLQLRSYSQSFTAKKSTVTAKKSTALVLQQKKLKLQLLPLDSITNIYILVSLLN